MEGDTRSRKERRSAGSSAGTLRTHVWSFVGDLPGTPDLPDGRKWRPPPADWREREMLAMRIVWARHLARLLTAAACAQPAVSWDTPDDEPCPVVPLDQLATCRQPHAPDFLASREARAA